MTERSRYTVCSQTHLPGERRTHSVWGSKEDTGKFFRCWHCGFICDITRDELNLGEHIRAGIVPTAFTDEDGETLYYPNVTGGCPFCGCKNYKG